MNISKEAYKKLVDKQTPGSPVIKNCIGAFFVGGAICVLGQFIGNIAARAGFDENGQATVTCIVLIGLSAVFTGLNLYGKLAKHAGAGTIVPITGFANSIVSPAIEFRSEGMITGMAVKMFTVAGPVLVYAISASVIYGLILVLMGYGGGA